MFTSYISPGHSGAGASVEIRSASMPPRRFFGSLVTSLKPSRIVRATPIRYGEFCLKFRGAGIWRRAFGMISMAQYLGALLQDVLALESNGRPSRFSLVIKTFD